MDMKHMAYILWACSLAFLLECCLGAVPELYSHVHGTIQLEGPGRNSPVHGTPTAV